MKINILKKWGILLISLAVISSCVDTEMNRDPNTSSNLDPNMQITTAQQFFNSYQDDIWRYYVFPGGFMNQWSNDWSVVYYGGIGKPSNTHSSRLWEKFYPGVIVNIVDVVEKTRDVADMANVNAAARVIKAQHFLKLTDYYGDIPYLDAGKVYYGGSFTPAYDTQEVIFDDMLKELKEAAAQFTTDASALKADLYFGGDLDKWRKFANSLRLRVALRLVKVKPELAKSEAEDAAKAGLMTSNADICFIQHADVISSDPSAGNGTANRLMPGGENMGSFRPTRDLIEEMEEHNDPRILFFASSYLDDGTNNTRTDITAELKAHYGSYKTFCIHSQEYSYSSNTVRDITNDLEITLKNGTTKKVPRLEQIMQPSRLISSPKSPFIHMSYAEVEFLLADAILRGYNVGGTAEQHYKAGLQAAVKQWSLFGATIDDAALNTFIASKPLPAGKDAGLKEVNTQLWILHFLDPLETWANVRRSGEPAERTQFYNRVQAENLTGGKTPRRMPYPVDEQTSNPKEYAIAVERIQGTVEGNTKDHWLNRVWWDKE